MREHGVVTAVEGPTPLGSSLAADAGIGSSTLTLYDVLDFSDAGGSAVIGSETVVYTARDTDLDTLTLSGVTTGAHVTDDAVTVSPEVFRYTAHVQLEGEDDDPILADVTHALKPFLPVGIREPGTEESVVIDNLDGRWAVVEVLGAAPILVGSAIYVPDQDDPQLTVDEEGHMVAKTVQIEPKDNASVALLISDSSATSGNWFETRDNGFVLLARINNTGEFGSTIGLGVYNTAGAGGNFTTKKLELTGTNGLAFYNVGVGIDVRIRRTGATHVELDDGASGGAVLDIVTRSSAPASPSAGRLSLYVTNDGSGHPQLRVKNSAGTVKDLTTFVDGS